MRAEQAAALIEDIAREALDELARLGPTSVNGEAADATPSLARVEQLAARTRATGLAVAVHVDGPTDALPAGVDLAAYRIVQEALANTTKHARASHAWVTVRCDRRALELEIADDGSGPDGRSPRRNGSGGHGLVGMRERVALYGGSLDAGARPGGGFRVRARLPIDVT
jgi:signal transduction histidine kinase